MSAGEDALDKLIAATGDAARGFETVEESEVPYARAGHAERELVKVLNSACRVARLHAIDNVVTQEVLAEFAERLAEYLQGPESPRVTVVRGEGRLAVNGAGIKLRRHGRSWINDWLSFMEQMGIGALELSGTWTLADCTLLLECLQAAGNGPPAQKVARIAAAADMKIALPAELKVLDPEEAAMLSGKDVEDDLPDAERAIFLYARLVALAEASVAAVRYGRSPDFQVRHLRSTLMKLIESLRLGVFEVRLLALTALPHQPRTPYETHLVNTAILAMAMGRLLGVSRGALIDLGFAAFYHDVGSGLLGLEAFHSVEAEDLERRDMPTLLSVASALRGRGYGTSGLARLAVAEEQGRVVRPRAASAGLRPPHPYSRVVAVASAFDRATNGSPNEAPLDPSRALERLQGDDAYPRTVVNLLRDALGVRPRGSLLRLGDGSVGVVVDGGARRASRAIVRRLFLPGGAPDERGLLSELAPDQPAEVAPRGAYEVDWVKALLR
ncbi:MAG: hypothetical protein AB7N76_18470 [Planctomycetota bacterium]